MAQISQKWKENDYIIRQYVLTTSEILSETTENKI